MSNPTTPFSWQMPTATDLVTDLPADFEVFGQAVATSMADLLGGTSGQILAKNSNTDMDFVWIANDQGDITAVTAGTGISGGGTSGAVTITNSMATEITAKGDLIVGTGSATFDNLAAGTNGQTLVADSSTATGLKWATASGGGKVLQVVSSTYSTSTNTTSTTFVDTGLTATITPSSATSKILVLVTQNGIVKESGNAAAQVNLQLLRGATQIGFISAMGYENSSKPLYLSTAGFAQLDSPSTTSATTYKTQFRNDVATTITVQVSSSTSQITLMEIGA